MYSVCMYTKEKGANQNHTVMWHDDMTLLVDAWKAMHQRIACMTHRHHLVFLYLDSRSQASLPVNVS
jgi:hypothetical protein